MLFTLDDEAGDLDLGDINLPVRVGEFTDEEAWEVIADDAGEASREDGAVDIGVMDSSFDSLDDDGANGLVNMGGNWGPVEGIGLRG